MLEKIFRNKQFSYFDAHFHYSDCLENGCFTDSAAFHGSSCFHSLEEWELWERTKDKLKSSISPAFGLHPQSAGYINVQENADFLEKLLQENKIAAIGEAGFDYFSQDFIQFEKLQEEMWNIQLDLATEYKLPLVIHCRKANHKLFEYSKQLKKLPAVLFHSFMGSPVEAMSLLKRGINGYFSFGKQLFNKNKKVIMCIKELPLNVLLCETDAPFQYLKGEKCTFNHEIKDVYHGAFFLRYDITDFALFAQTMSDNYSKLFNTKPCKAIQKHKLFFDK